MLLSLKMSRKVIVLGLDGASWNLIGEWINQGELPTFKRLMDNYAHGTLNSIVMPLTFIAWPTMFTGKNPGKHGIVCLGEFSRRKYRFSHYNSSENVKSDFLWEILERNSIRCGLIDIPLSSPFRSPITFGEGDKFRKDWMNFEWKEDTRVGILPSDKNFGNRINEILELRFDQLEYVLENREFDFLAMDISCLDPLQHFKWHDKEFLKETFKRIDSRLERVLEKLDKETLFFLVSDHGMIKLEKWLRVNNWLEKKGYLKFKGGKIESSKIAEAGINKENFELITNPFISLIVRLGIKKFIPREIINSFRRLRRHQLLLKDEIFGEKLIGLIDWENTKAHALGNEGSIYINLKGRDDYGSVSTEEYDSVRERIIEDLKEDFEDVEIFKREDIYEGAYVDMAPDIMFIINDGSIKTGGYSPSGSLFKEAVPGKDVMSNHSLHGIFLTYGEEFKRMKIDPVIYDITPTVLHIFGLPIPKDMDGRVLKEIFREDSEPGKREVKYKEPESRDRIREIVDELEL